MFWLMRIILCEPFSSATSMVLSLESSQYRFLPTQSKARPSTRERPLEMKVSGLPPPRLSFLISLVSMSDQ